MFIRLLNKYNLTPKQLFLIDSIGAFFTGFILVLIQFSLNAYVGMPIKVLSVLILIAFGYSTFSLFCFCFVKQNWQVFLTIVYIANLLYCLLMLVLVALFFSDLTRIGIIYFVLEICVIVILALVERAYVISNR